MQLTGQKIVFDIEKYFDVQFLDLSYLVISNDMGYNIAMYRAVSHRIPSKHQENTNSTKPHHLVVVYSCFFRLCLCPHLGLCSVRPFLSSFSCPSARHIIIGLTVPPATSNRVLSGLTLLPERMFVLFHFSFFFYFFSHFLSSFLLDTWYLVLLSIVASCLI